MARQLAVTKLKSIWNTIKAQIWVLVLSILSYLYGLVVIVGGGASLVFAAREGFSAVPAITVGVGALFVLGWVVLPLVFSSQEGTLDPRKLVAFLAPTRRLAWSLVLAAGVGVAGVYFALVVGFLVATWAVAYGPLAALVGLVGGLAGMFISFVWSRAVVAWASIREMGRVGKERAGILGMVLLLLVVTPMGVWLPLVADGVSAQSLMSALTYVSYTPFGAPWALADAVGQQDWGRLAIYLLVTAATAYIGWRFWLRQLGPAMYGAPARISPAAENAISAGRASVVPVEQTPKSQGAPDYFSGVGRWLRLGLSRPAAAIAERTRIYWFKDPRLVAQVVGFGAVLLMAIVVSAMFSGGEDGVPPQVSAGMGWFMFALAGFMFGQVLGTLLQFDSTALWVSVAAGVPGRADRAGRLAGSLPLLLGLALVSAVLFGVLTGQGAGAIFSLFAVITLLAAAGFSAAVIVGSQWVYPVQAPGSTPFSAKQTGELTTVMLVNSLTFVGAALLVFIPLGVTGWALLSGAPWLAWASAASLVWAAGLAYLGVAVGGKLLDRNQAHLLTKISSWPGHRAP